MGILDAPGYTKAQGDALRVRENKDALRYQRVVPKSDRTITTLPVPSDVTVTGTAGSTSNITGTIATYSANDTTKFRWSQCRAADIASPFNPISPGGTCDGTSGSATVTNVSNLTFTNGQTVLVYNTSGSQIISQSSTTISSGGGTSTLVLNKTLTAGGTGLLIGVPTGTFRANAPQPYISAGGPDAAIVSSFDYMAYSALTEVTFFTRKSGASNNAWYEIYVDGALVTPVTVSASTLGNRMVAHIALSARRAHHVRVVSRGLDILKVEANNQDTLWLSKIPLYRARAVIIGDSWTAAANDNYGRAFWVDVCEMLGWECVPSGQSGSGYMVTGSSGTGATTFRDRIALVAGESPDVLIFAGSVNDTGAATPSQIQTEAAAVFAQAATTFPGVPVIVVGPQDTPGMSGYSSSAYTAHDAAVSAAAAAASNVVGYVSVAGWITGTGTTGSTTGTGNGDIFMSPTSPAAVHMNDAGHRYFALRLAQALMPLASTYRL